MSANNTLERLVSDLSTQHALKADYILPANSITMVNNMIEVIGSKKYKPNTVFHEGLAYKLGIPGGYYRRMQAEVPELLDQSVNAWLHHLGGKKVMLRAFENKDTMQNIARAFLSDRYQALDNYDVLFAVLDAIKNIGVKVEIKNADVTDKRLYINVVAPEIEVEAHEILKGYLRDRTGTGTGIISGFCITNSEVGYGSFDIRPRAVILRCQNGMIATDDRFRKVHLGSRLSEGQINWSQETKNKNYDLIISQTKDAIRTFLNPDYLGRMIKRIYEAHQVALNYPIDTVNNVCKELKYSEEQRREILNHFLEGGDMRASGVSHAITMQAQQESPDIRYEMETTAYNLLPKVKAYDKPFSHN